MQVSEGLLKVQTMHIQRTCCKTDMLTKGQHIMTHSIYALFLLPGISASNCLAFSPNRLNCVTDGSRGPWACLGHVPPPRCHNVVYSLTSMAGYTSSSSGFIEETKRNNHALPSAACCQGSQKPPNLQESPVTGSPINQTFVPAAQNMTGKTIMHEMKNQE